MVQFGLNQVSILVLIVNFHLFWILIAAIVSPIAYGIFQDKKKTDDGEIIEILKPSTKWDNLRNPPQYPRIPPNHPPRPKPQMGLDGRMIS